MGEALKTAEAGASPAPLVLVKSKPYTDAGKAVPSLRGDESSVTLRIIQSALNQSEAAAANAAATTRSAEERTAEATEGLEWCTWALVLAAVIASIISIWSITMSRKSARESAILTRQASEIAVKNQISNVILHCNVRYDELYEFRSSIESEFKTLPFLTGDESRTQRASIEAANKVKVNNFFSRYWGLKSDQFDYWLAGNVDPETLTSWLVSVPKYLDKGEVGGVHFRTGWFGEGGDVGVANFHKAVNPTLYAFVNAMFDVVNRKDTSTSYIVAYVIAFLLAAEENKGNIIGKLSVSTARFTVKEFLDSRGDVNLNNRVKYIRPTIDMRDLMYRSSEL